MLEFEEKGTELKVRYKKSKLNLQKHTFKTTVLDFTAIH